ncbi:YoaK family protein [Massilia sp. TSP1-1-2]|uniref:YoaK family protein n=1 Tax=unclassified Massilia TaxID=2609279 RepID=UPI003CE90748
MPINYSRKLTGRVRTAHTNRHLGYALTFVAGAINAGGFLAVEQYTSHMTGIVSSMADNLALGTVDIALAGLGALFAFIVGAACSTMLVHYSRQRQMHSEFALPLLLEACLLLCFGLLGARLADIDGYFVSVTVILLSFIMGLQNAVITSLSNAEIRTTHVTGIVTDIGIELGKLVYPNRGNHAPGDKVAVNRPRLKMLCLLVLCFFVGGVAGALGFKHVGYIATVPLALVLLGLASVPVVDDLHIIWRRKL